MDGNSKVRAGHDQCSGLCEEVGIPSGHVADRTPGFTGTPCRAAGRRISVCHHCQAGCIEAEGEKLGWCQSLGKGNWWELGCYGF